MIDYSISVVSELNQLKIQKLVQFRKFCFFLYFRIKSSHRKIF